MKNAINFANEQIKENGEMNEWGRNSIYFMFTKGIIKGMGDNKFAPQETATIEQALAIVLRCIEAFKVA